MDTIMLSKRHTMYESAICRTTTANQKTSQKRSVEA